MKGNGTATTIQEGIDMVDRGGKVLVLPGTYDEAIVIDKGLTLEGLGGESGPVVVSPSGTVRSEEHRLNSSHANISYAVFCLKKKRILWDSAIALITAKPQHSGNTRRLTRHATT